MIETLLNLVVVLVIVGAIIWIVEKLPLQEPWKGLIKVIMVIVALIFCLRALLRFTQVLALSTFIVVPVLSGDTNDIGIDSEPAVGQVTGSRVLADEEYRRRDFDYKIELILGIVAAALGIWARIQQNRGRVSDATLETLIEAIEKRDAAGVVKEEARMIAAREGQTEFLKKKVEEVTK